MWDKYRTKQYSYTSHTCTMQEFKQSTPTSCRTGFYASNLSRKKLSDIKDKHFDLHFRTNKFAASGWISEGEKAASESIWWRGSKGQIWGIGCWFWEFSAQVNCVWGLFLWTCWQASYLPMSIIIVGVGQEDFSGEWSHGSKIFKSRKCESK